MPHKKCHCLPSQLSSGELRIFGAVCLIPNYQQVIKLFKLLPFSLPSKWEVQFQAQTHPTWLKNITREGSATEPLLSPHHNLFLSCQQQVLGAAVILSGLWLLWETLEMVQMLPMGTEHCSYTYKGEQPQICLFIHNKGRDSSQREAFSSPFPAEGAVLQ